MKRRKISQPADANPDLLPAALNLPGTARPPASLTRWPGFLLAWVADLAGSHYSQALAPLGIKPQHLGILTLLAGEGPLVQARIGERLAIVKPQIVGLLNELEALGLVERRPHPSDGRAYEIHLRKRAQTLLAQADQISQTASEAFFGGLSEAERQTLYRLLWRLAETQGAAPPS